MANEPKTITDRLISLLFVVLAVIAFPFIITAVVFQLVFSFLYWKD